MGDNAQRLQDLIAVMLQRACVGMQPDDCSLIDCGMCPMALQNAWDASSGFVERIAQKRGREVINEELEAANG